MSKVVKICGLKSHEAAETAIKSGTDLLGFILVPNRARTVDRDMAKDIVQLAKTTRKNKQRKFQEVKELQEYLKGAKFSNAVDYYEKLSELLIENGPFAVGVFRNQPLEEVFEIASDLKLDFIQLHGSENKWAFIERNSGEFGIIGRYVIPNEVEKLKLDVGKFATDNQLVIPLLDSEAGGEGKVIDWEVVNNMSFGGFLLAGGLSPTNLEEAHKVNNVIGYDVSGGVETGGVKDLEKVRQFIKLAKIATN